MVLFKKSRRLERNTVQKKFYNPEEHSGICVVRRENEKVEDLIKRFRKKFSKSGIAKEYKDKMYYEKPSDKKRRKRIQSIRNSKREQEKQLETLSSNDKFFNKKQERN